MCIERVTQTRGMENDTKWQNLQALKELHNQGFITNTEYRERLKQLIDELTGTTISTPAGSRIQRDMSIDSAIVARPPPDFEDVEEETGIRWTYDFKKEKWASERIRLKLDSTPFARGALRVAYHMKILSKHPKSSSSSPPAVPSACSSSKADDNSNSGSNDKSHDKPKSDAKGGGGGPRGPAATTQISPRTTSPHYCGGSVGSAGGWSEAGVGGAAREPP
eukprot:CAMPEP_0167811896 /NCGR_PEP_ID=MMETSP0112_2-20121227/937_1 /TAXON_ID=91324 /ORGANISM="Lotharella globosa, Strain CCCM811" /LENGTH=220 /DNA_ID=CAMNT_0007710687 /DNA_START=201 /DNA_END=859 /DNA_ORIENTATION=-